MIKLLLPILITIPFLSEGQIFMTKQQIVSEYGRDYTTGTTNDGSPYIKYVFDDIVKVMYFLRTDSGKEVCYSWRIFVPHSSVQEVIEIYDKDFVRTGHLRWRDVENEYNYRMEIKKYYAVISVYWEE